MTIVAWFLILIGTTGIATGMPILIWGVESALEAMGALFIVGVAAAMLWLGAVLLTVNKRHGRFLAITSIPTMVLLGYATAFAPPAAYEILTLLVLTIPLLMLITAIWTASLRRPAPRSTANHLDDIEVLPIPATPFEPCGFCGAVVNRTTLRVCPYCATATTPVLELAVTQ